MKIQRRTTRSKTIVINPADMIQATQVVLEEKPQEHCPEIEESMGNENARVTKQVKGILLDYVKSRTNVQRGDAAMLINALIGIIDEIEIQTSQGKEEDLAESLLKIKEEKLSKQVEIRAANEIKRKLEKEYVMEPPGQEGISKSIIIVKEADASKVTAAKVEAKKEINKETLAKVEARKELKKETAVKSEAKGELNDASIISERTYKFSALLAFYENQNK